MNLLIHKDADFAQKVDLLVHRRTVEGGGEETAVREIVEAVRREGDAALLRCTRQFDHVDWAAADLEVKAEEIEAAYRAVGEKEVAALKTAAENIRKFHSRQRQDSWEYEEGGARLGQIIRPLEVVGVYVPGGKAAYPSSVLMNAVPAVVAGVSTIVMCSPARHGETSPHALVAADLAGVSRIFKVGGAQAVAAMAYGTATVPGVDKIVGPGNIYVALAKRLVFGRVDIDMIAGPSEILVLADDSARPEFVAADLLSQAEHDEAAAPLLVTPSEALARATLKALDRQRRRLKRQAIIEVSLRDQCRLVVTASMDAAVDLANRIAPEHLELAVAEPRAILPRIKNAGAVFLGHYTPEAIGDYLAGPNHVLPTSGTARFSSPLGVYDFIKRISLIEYSREALRAQAETCRTLALMEHLDAHAEAVNIRLENRLGHSGQPGWDQPGKPLTDGGQ